MADRNDEGVKWIASYRVCIAFCGLYHVRIIKLEMHGGLHLPLDFCSKRGLAL
jgi:hypothetical protein